MLDKLLQAEEAARIAKSNFYDAIEETIKALCQKHNVDHICFEEMGLPYYYDEQEELVMGAASVRLDPDTGTLQVTSFFEEDWDRAMNREGYIWIDAFDVTINLFDLSESLGVWASMKEEEVENA